MRIYQNYHRHSHYTNPKISDSTVTNEDYAKRAVDFGHGIISTMEHGYQGRYIEGYNLAQKYNLKFVFGSEAYWVRDRYDKDRSNCHIYLGARNEHGRQAINDILSEANLTGFYGQARVDVPLILSLPPEDVIVTTACLQYWKYEDVDEITKAFLEHFGKNLFLEVQYHDTDAQKDINSHILQLHNDLKIPLIMGCDSHYIFPEQAQNRTDFLISKGIEYPEETGWFLDYPDGDTAYERFAKQCVLNGSDIVDAMDNTNVFLDVEEYDSPIFNKDIKMPTLYPDWTQEQRDEEYKRIIWENWNEYKKSVPVDQYAHYEEEIEKEVQTVVDTHMADYFLDNYYIIKQGKLNGGQLTYSGRGCFTGEALIKTMLGLKQLKDVDSGDIVFDMYGNPQEVTNTFKYHICEPMVKINVPYAYGLQHQSICTRDHKIFVHRNGNNQWIQASDIQIGDYLIRPKIHIPEANISVIDLAQYCRSQDWFDENFVYEYNADSNGFDYCPNRLAPQIGCSKTLLDKIVQGHKPSNARSLAMIQRFFELTPFKTFDEYAAYVKENRVKKLNRFITIDEEFCTFVGLMYGDGFARKEGGTFGLAINPTNYKNIVNKTIFQNVMSQIGINTYERFSPNRNLIQIFGVSLVFQNFLHAMLFVSQKRHNKYMNPFWLKQSQTRREALLKGFLLTDGSFSESTRISFDNTSPSLINAVDLLVSTTTNNPCSLAERSTWTDSRGYTCRTSYKLRIYNNADKTVKSNNRILKDENYTYIPVHSVEFIDATPMDVFDIEVGETHSYVLNGIVVHNSAVSFFTNKLLGFTEVDRIAASVKMYPERFMSTTRILQSKSLPDIDMNSASQDPFALAQQQVLGEDHSYPMISYNTMKASAAWKLYAKSQGVPFETANIVSDQIRKYEMAVKHAPEEEADTIDVKDYISREYWDIYDKSADYLGLISSWSISPCSYLLYQGSIRKEIGLIQIKDHLCCLMDGHWAEENHFLKNDQLKVSVWDLIYRVYGKIGLQPHSVSELLAMCPSDDKVWDIYKKGCTLGINQVEQSGTSARVAMYHPTNISELCAFVAAIRPGFKSMYKIFESRLPFKYGVKAFDELIQTKEMPNSFVLYQEMEMAALNYAGIPMDECYTAIKNIAKKRVEKVLAYKEQFINGFTEAIIRDEHKTQEEAIKLSEQLWQIIEDSSRYSFNACLAESVVLDKAGLRNGLFNPSVGEMYKICTDINYAKATHHYDLHKKYRRYGYGNALSMYPDGCVRKNNIVGIYPSGKRQCYLVTTQNGHQIECTDNHKFPTPDGYKKLSELKVNDLLYVKGRYEKCKKTYPYTDGNFELNVPKQGERGFQRKPDGASVKYQASRLEHIANCDSCARCGQEYFGDIRFELHHHDFNRTNNDESNLEWLCVSCHKKAHYEHGRTKVFERGSPAQIDVIVSITPTTIQETYDVEMQDPAHTVISESGLVASNSHSYCVALDSLYGAWLKTYHPLEFYEALLQVYEDKGDKDKMALAKEEAKDYFGINFPPYRFGQDNRQIVADSEHNAINNSLTAIKGYGSDVAVLLYECSQMGFTDLVDVLKWLDEHSIKSAKTKPLARIDYFQSFGTIREVLEIIDLFDFLKQGNAKTIKKELVPPYLIPLMERFMNGTNAKGVELKSYTITDMNGLLHEITSFVKSRNLGDISIKVRIQNCIDVLGTPDIATGKPEDRRKLIITAVAPLLSATTGRPWAYKVGAQSLGTGKTSKLTVRASLFSQNALNTGDVIYAKDVSKNDKGFWYLNLYSRIE
ncbi:MAG TPA: PHP domain-containing protein [Saprospiraceae bacterium]|nr:PHP domain-containing protein [Saprospiraceae bacterium]